MAMQPILFSAIDLQLPAHTRVAESVTAQELQDIYAAFRKLQQTLTTYESRITALEQYNIAHP